MMKKTVRYLLLGVAVNAICTVALSQAVAQNTNNVIKFNNSRGATYISEPQEAKAVPVVAGDDLAYQELIINAVSLHNFVRLIDMQLENAKEFEFAVWNKEVDKARITNFDACEEALLAKNFKNPAKLWKKLKDKADALLQQYNATHIEELADIEERLAQAMSMSEEERMDALEAEKKKKHDVNKDQLLSDFVDSSIEWQIGFIVLNSFYPNQDAWAERINENTPSLPLWTDQKYLYNRDVWKPKYEEIVKHCKAQGVKLKLKEPEIKDEFKYDYYFYDRVEKAHNLFCRAAMAQECILTPKMKKAPEKAPAPLPPVDEEIMVLPHSPMTIKKGQVVETFPENDKIPVGVQDGSEIIGVYPQNPKNPKQYDRAQLSDAQIQNMPPEFIADTLWDVYKQEKFEDVEKEGEFRLYFDDKLNLTDHAINQPGNRISKYFELKNTAEISENVYQNYVSSRDEMAAGLKDYMEKYQLDLPENMDYLSTQDLEKLKRTILDKRDALVLQAKQALNITDEQLDQLTTEELQEDKYLAFLRAFGKDKNATVQLTNATATSIEDAMKEAAADKELLTMYSAESNKIKRQLLNKKNHAADEATCLRSSGGVLVDLKKVEIK